MYFSDELNHIGVAKRSGRYPYGSGKMPFQHHGDFLSRVDSLKKDGLSETDIATFIGLTTTQLRIQQSLAKDERRVANVSTAKALQEKGLNPTQIAREMGYSSESSVRSLLNPQIAGRMSEASKTATFLRERVNEKGMIDVGKGVNLELNISKERLDQALYILELEGYNTYGGRVPQITNRGRQTTMRVLCPPGTAHKEIYNFDNVSSINEYTSHDDGTNFDKYTYPRSMDSKRIAIRYAEDKGTEKDGLVEIRRNVDDLSLGKSKYAQVRILVDNDRYIKGMAVYSDDLPKGVDIVFNTNKPKGTPKSDVFKKIKEDPDNPFGALIKAGGQSYYLDKNGERQLSPINKTREEGDWDNWSKKLPSQFLAKQNKQLMRKQLEADVLDHEHELNDILKLNNPAVKKALLEPYALQADAAAVHLQAASLPRQKYHVLLPVPGMKDTEVYAPNYDNGEKIALVRFPHGGTFEIPVLTVNNKLINAKKLMGNATDAIGINAKVAEQLSGADFDGDAVMTIPSNEKNKIAARPSLQQLNGFDPKMQYPETEGMKYMSYEKIVNGRKKIVDGTQGEMGKISNLITDMTARNATDDELARAVKHSMVVIDAGKHKLNYKLSEIDNNIAGLKSKYQGYIDENGKMRSGASTLLSRAKSDYTVNKRVGSPIIDPETGKVSYKESGKTYIDPKTGVEKKVKQRSTLMLEIDDANKISSGTQPEEVYAEYANKMKALANRARKELVATGKIEQSKTAKETYKKEVSSLNEKLNRSESNAPKERKAQLYANSIVKAKKQDNPDMTLADEKKAGQLALTSAREKMGAKRYVIEITDREWDAIQAGAISDNKLTKIIRASDQDKVRERATPRTAKIASPAKVNKMKSMYNSGNYTLAEIARAVGMSTSVISGYVK